MKNEWQRKELLRDYVGTVGVEKALEELPPIINLFNLVKNCCAPTVACLYIKKGDCCGRTMWFVGYDDNRYRETSYFQHNASSLKDAIAGALYGLCNLGVLNFAKYEQRMSK